jgi:hypothetical protein
MMRGAIPYLSGDWASASPLLQEAESLFANECTGVTWELDTVRFFSVFCQLLAGDMTALKSRAQVLFDDAVSRQDLYASTTLGALVRPRVWLADGSPRRAADELSAAITSWTQKRFDLLHMWETWTVVDIALYEGRGDEAVEAARREWPALRRSLLQFVHFHRVVTREVRARAELAALRAATQAGSHRPDCAGAARRLAGSLRRQRSAWASGFASLIDASLHHIEGRDADAVHALAEAEQHFMPVGMHLHATAARRSRGFITGDDSGRALIDASDSWMREHGIVDPDAMTRMLVPGIC